MKYKVLVSEKVSEEAINLLMQNGIEVKYGRGLDETTVSQDIQDCDAVIVRVMGITRRIIDSSKKLKVIAKHGVGCDSIDLLAAKEHGIPVLYTPEANSLSVAEHTMMLILACAKQLRLSNLAYSSGNYDVKNEIKISEINSKKLALIGCGKVAGYVARMASQGFNMKVFGFDPYLATDMFPNEICPVESIDYLLSQADFVSLHIPATDKNKDFFDKDKFCKMKRTAYLINTARGTVVNQQDMIWAVKNGRIAGAGLDVSNPEPTEIGSELFQNPRFILTPHCGASSQEAMVRMGIQTAEGIIDVLNNRIPKFLVTG